MRAGFSSESFVSVTKSEREKRGASWHISILIDGPGGSAEHSLRDKSEKARTRTYRGGGKRDDTYL